MNPAGVFMFNAKEDEAEASNTKKWMVGGRAGALLFLALAIFVASALCGYTYYYGIRSAERINMHKEVASGPPNHIASIDEATEAIPKLLATYSLASAIVPLAAFVAVMWLGAWLFARKADRAAASFFFHRRVKAAREQILQLCGEDEAAHGIVQVDAPAMKCALHSFNLAFGSLILVELMAIVSVAALSATGPYLVEEYGLYLAFLAVPAIATLILWVFRPNVFRASYIVVSTAIVYFSVYVINPVIGQFALTWPPSVIAALVLLMSFGFVCKSSLGERAILISPKGLRVIEVFRTEIKESAPLFVPDEVKVGKATSGPSLSFKTAANETMLFVPTMEKAAPFFTLTLGAGLDLKQCGTDEPRSPLAEARTEPLRFAVGLGLAAACLFVGRPVMRLSLYLGLCIIVAIAPFFSEDPKGVDVMAHACQSVLKAIPNEPVSLCFLWMAHNAKGEYDLADKQKEALKKLKEQMKIPKLWNVGQVGVLYGTIKEQTDRREKLINRKPSGWEPSKEGRRDFIIGAGIAANQISSLGVKSLDQQVPKLLLDSHRLEPTAPGPPIMLAYYLYSEPEYVAQKLSSVKSSPKTSASGLGYTPAGIEHKLRMFKSSYANLRKMLVKVEEQPKWRGLLFRLDGILPLKYRRQFLTQLLEDQLGGKDRMRWQEAFYLMKSSSFIAAPSTSGENSAMAQLVLNPPDEMSKVVASWPELEGTGKAITTSLINCDEKTFYDFFKKAENRHIVTRLNGAKAKKAKEMGIWPSPNKR